MLLSLGALVKCVFVDKAKQLHNRAGLVHLVAAAETMGSKLFKIPGLPQHALLKAAAMVSRGTPREKMEIIRSKATG